MIQPNDDFSLSPEIVDKLNDWRTKDWAINIYRCENNHLTTTVDVDEGTTPFLMECPFCKSTAQSMCYPRERPFPSWVPNITHEWYRMNGNKVDALDKNSKYHHENGGLFLRKRTKKLPIKSPYQ